MENKTAVGTIFISTKTKRVLFNLRAPHKTHKLKWGLWGGKIEHSETPKEALLRELKEEMGFVPDINKIYPFDVYESKDRNFIYYSFVSVVDEEFIPKLNDESCGYSWCALGIWPSPMHDGARQTLCNKKALLKLELILSQF